MGYKSKLFCFCLTSSQDGNVWSYGSSCRSTVSIYTLCVTQKLCCNDCLGECSLSVRQILARSRLLRENGRFLTHQGFLTRKHYFNNPENGFLRKTKRKMQLRNPLTDPTMVTEMLKGNIINVLPMILVGGWINWAFSGFVATKVPFPLTLRFKPMLQRGINLLSLDPSWVSSASWYFLKVFGLRRVYNLIPGEETAAEHNQLLLQDHFLGPTVPAPPDPNKAFKAEWEALELVSHHWALQDVEEQLMGQDLKLSGRFRPD
ncbi:ER membrane protein complex subunit 3-like isoform X1 [Sphaerodactylus townsendi]|uniref:ER membrane protein complex subunit 3-like isoform X1 n=1 Tax=Sphaerodactylus townsendi TaxID=933632 RepID=UPI002025E2B9|nr:ER membrane protein complex subunit 3-like isoform X1 [Sphaerodactylus townsendi]